LQSTTPLSDFPYFVADCIHLIYPDKIIGGMPLLEHVRVLFLYSLPTVDYSFRRDVNCILRKERGIGARVMLIVQPRRASRSRLESPAQFVDRLCLSFFLREFS
jgi:hypothetical protein